MNLKQSTKFFLWYGNADKAGHTFSEEELELYKAARKTTENVAFAMFGLRKKDYEYTKGQPFES